MLVVNAIDTPEEWGVVTVIVAIAFTLVTTFVWWVRAARMDLQQSHVQFVQYLQETATRQTEAIVTSTSALVRMTEMLDRHEERAEDRHRATTASLRRIEGHVVKGAGPPPRKGDG